MRKVMVPKKVASALGRFVGVWDDFHLNSIFRWLLVFTKSETAVTIILFNGIMSATNATYLAKKML